MIITCIINLSQIINDVSSEIDSCKYQAIPPKYNLPFIYFHYLAAEPLYY